MQITTLPAIAVHLCQIYKSDNLHWLLFNMKPSPCYQNSLLQRRYGTQFAWFPWMQVMMKCHDICMPQIFARIFASLQQKDADHHLCMQGYIMHGTMPTTTFAKVTSCMEGCRRPPLPRLHHAWKDADDHLCQGCIMHGRMQTTTFAKVTSCMEGCRRPPLPKLHHAWKDADDHLCQGYIMHGTMPTTTFTKVTSCMEGCRPCHIQYVLPTHITLSTDTSIAVYAWLADAGSVARPLQKNE